MGPATSSPEKIRELVDAGMDVARLNMSHGTRDEHAEVYRLIRAASDTTGHGVGIFADLQGPKIRLGNFQDGKETIEPGDRFTITTRDILGNATICGTTYDGLPGDVTAGHDILIDDGKVRLRVDSVEGKDVHTTVIVGGTVSNHKGINLPGVPVSVPAMSEKDIEDLRWALHLTVDYVALSFVRSAKDADDVRQIMRE
jgi:pyruvate kinase